MQNYEERKNNYISRIVSNPFLLSLLGNNNALINPTTEDELNRAELSLEVYEDAIEITDKILSNEIADFDFSNNYIINKLKGLIIQSKNGLTPQDANYSSSDDVEIKSRAKKAYDTLIYANIVSSDNLIHDLFLYLISACGFDLQERSSIMQFVFYFKFAAVNLRSTISNLSITNSIKLYNNQDLAEFVEAFHEFHEEMLSGGEMKLV